MWIGHVLVLLFASSFSEEIILKRAERIAEQKHINVSLIPESLPYFLSGGLLSHEDCSKVQEFVQSKGNFVDFEKFTPDFGLESYQSPREVYIERPGKMHLFSSFPHSSLASRGRCWANNAKSFFKSYSPPGPTLLHLTPSHLNALWACRLYQATQQFI
jgi:hypothetical protein